VLDDIYFCSSQVGFLTSDAGIGTGLYKSIDGGEKWVQKFISYPFTDVWFFDRDIGFASGGWASECFHCLITLGDVFRTNNAGISWNKCFETGLVEAICFLGDEVGFSLSWKWVNGMELGTISNTTDSGANWIDVYQDNPDPAGYFFTGNDLCFINDQRG